VLLPMHARLPSAGTAPSHSAQGARAFVRMPGFPGSRRAIVKSVAKADSC